MSLTHGRGSSEVHFVACGACSAHIGATRARSPLPELAKGRSNVVTQTPSGICHLREAVTGVARFTHSHCILREALTGTSVHARTPSSSEESARNPVHAGCRILRETSAGTPGSTHGRFCPRARTDGTVVHARRSPSSGDDYRDQGLCTVACLFGGRRTEPGPRTMVGSLGRRRSGMAAQIFGSEPPGPTVHARTPNTAVLGGQDLGSRRMLRPSGKSSQNHGSRMDAATFGRRRPGLHGPRKDAPTLGKECPGSRFTHGGPLPRERSLGFESALGSSYLRVRTA